MNRNTFGEALIVIAVIAGFFFSSSPASLSMENIWSSAIMLGVIVVFYFCLLFARMLFYWMTGGDAAPFDWQQHVHHEPPSKKK